MVDERRSTPTDPSPESRATTRPPPRVLHAAEPDGGSGQEEEPGGKGAGRKGDVQQDPDDQRGRADPKEGEGRGAP